MVISLKKKFGQTIFYPILFQYNFRIGQSNLRLSLVSIFQFEVTGSRRIDIRDHSNRIHRPVNANKSRHEGRNICLFYIPSDQMSKLPWFRISIMRRWVGIWKRATHATSPCNERRSSIIWVFMFLLDTK